jgi:hypothetical protein
MLAALTDGLKTRMEQKITPPPWISCWDFIRKIPGGSRGWYWLDTVTAEGKPKVDNQSAQLEGELPRRASNREVHRSLPADHEEVNAFFHLRHS